MLVGRGGQVKKEGKGRLFGKEGKKEGKKEGRKGRAREIACACGTRAGL